MTDAEKTNERSRVLLTGGTGLVGRTLAPLLRERYDVTHFDLADPDDGLPWIDGDLRDAEAVEKACEGMDAIVHVAALHGPAWQAAGDHAGVELNVMGTHNILEGARKGGARRVVFTSSIWATGHLPVPPPYLPIDENLPREPIEAYGLTKKLGEQMCRFAAERHGLSTICLRPGGILSEDAPFERRVNLLFGAVDVRDVADAHVLALEAPDDIRHDTFVITADSPLCRIDPTHFSTDPAGVLEGLFPGFKRLIDDGTLNAAGPREWYSVDRAAELLGYRPRHAFEMSES